MYVDSHCHLERETYGNELAAVIERAWAAGLSHLVAVGSSRGLEGAVEAIGLAETDARIYATVGYHPHEAKEAGASELERLEQLLQNPKVVALGEIGLDYFYDHSPREQQRRVFRDLLQLARRSQRPIMLHVRDAHPDTYALLDEIGLPEAGGVVHCFTSGPSVAEQYLRRGLYLSIPGVVTFKKADELREAVKVVPIDRILIETDSPYLAPLPYRGKRNEPAYVVETAKAIGAIKGLSGPELGDIARANTIRLFHLVTLPKG
jgi:TatD DNase family protein